MARLSRSSGISSSSTPSSAVDSDTTTTVTTTTTATPIEQSLTPATSQSETSSTNENVAAEVENKEDERSDGGKQRRSRRVTRSSLATTTVSNDVAVEEPVSKDSNEGKNTRRSLDSKPLEGGAIAKEEGMEEKQDKAQLGDNELEKDATDAKQVERPGKQDVGGARRRSSRLVVLEKTSEVVERASTVLGKRSRGVVLKGKDRLKVVSRRASLRPRNVVREEAPAAPSAEGPAVKKRRVSEGDAVGLKKTARTAAAAEEEEPEPKPKPAPYKRKKWLSHGMYAGQDRYFDPRLTEEKNRIKFGEKNAEERKKLFPLPMFAGERLIEEGRDFKLPFDIFSPLPPGQPKPDEWRKTNKNVFVGDAAGIWKATKLSECSTCMCTPDTGCDENCQNRYMFYECDDNNCKLGAELCGNRSFEGLRQRTKVGGKFNIGVEVIKTADRGYGVRSNRSFAPNQIIVEYTGEIVTQEECERRMRSVYKDNECYYLMYFDQNMIIDATRGSIARFVNHSCEPNCKMEKWTVAGKPRMALFAGENGIMTGEELTYDYNFDPYSQKNVQECRCGAPTCRGVLGPKPKDSNRSKQENPKQSKDAKKKKSPTAAGKKRKQEETVLDESSTSRLNKRRKILKPASKALKAGVKKAVSGARSATTTASKRTKAKPKPKSKPRAKATTATTTTAKTVKAKAAPVKKTKVRPRTKASAATTKTKTAAAPRKSKTQAQAQAQTTSQSKSTKLNRPTKKLNSIAAARSASKTPAAMRRFLGAGKKSSEEGGAKGASKTSAVDKKPSPKKVATKGSTGSGTQSRQSKVIEAVKGLVGAVRRGRKAA
ncbi:hypothetical protein AJ79_05412 [Helicocarpus griseus UAMH5409]|uniref:Histone-lysine N-methyltransferase n=1 Tax=Helicocarpus griseus UAMH5409 TaxID=1447875 RepID=A0A2B7XNN3_9EURO|nr:hypothetical protein AJ79_05412 [Helicocarpus griseus UAMH5409]